MRLHLRVGIHLGDVVSDERADISGDAVNVASRIVPLASDGGVCLTRQVHDSVKGKIDLEMKSVGGKNLKNVSEPIEIFRMIMPWSLNEADVVDKELHRKRIAILPFRNMSPDPNDEYFSEGMTEELITTLARIRDLTVIARTSIMQYKNTTKRISEISKELGAGTLIEGSVRKSGEKVRITVQLLDSKTEGHLWAENYDNKYVGDVFAIQSEIAEKVARELRIQLGGPERKVIETVPTQVPAAYTLYLKGRHYWNERTKEGVEKAISYFQEAISRDAQFALGYSGLADCYLVMARNGLAEFGPSYEQAKKFATIALDLDPNLAEAHAARGSTLHYYERKWEASEVEFRTAIGLKPSYASAHQWYSHVLAQERRFDEAEREIRKAIELDPFSHSINHNLGAYYYFIGDYDRAIEQLDRLKELYPKDLAPYVGPGPSLIRAFVQKREYENAMREIEKLAKITNSPKQVKRWKAYVLASSGEKFQSRELISEVEPDYRSENISPYEIALVYFLLGETDTGFDWIKSADEAHDGNINMLAIDVELRALRNHPRYLAMLNKIGLSSVSFET